MTGKHLKNGDIKSIYNLTQHDMGPFNHTNIISGEMRVRKFHIQTITTVEIHKKCLALADYIQDQTNDT
jgi:hypothetical protein